MTFFRFKDTLNCKLESVEVGKRQDICYLHHLFVYEKGLETPFIFQNAQQHPSSLKALLKILKSLPVYLVGNVLFPVLCRRIILRA
jgi:hypothetical protein